MQTSTIYKLELALQVLLFFSKYWYKISVMSIPNFVLSILVQDIKFCLGYQVNVVDAKYCCRYQLQKGTLSSSQFSKYCTHGFQLKLHQGVGFASENLYARKYLNISEYSFRNHIFRYIQPIENIQIFQNIFMILHSRVPTEIALGSLLCL